MMMSMEDFGIFQRCSDLEIVKSYPRLSYIRPRRPRSKMIRRPRASVAAVAAELVPVPVPVVGQSTESQPQQPPAGQNQPPPPPVAAVVVEAVAVTAVVAQEQPLVHPDWLPLGWTIERTTRENGASAGNRDKYYRDPSGKKFRSRPDVERHLDKLKLNPLSGIGKGKGRRGNIYPISLSSELRDAIFNISFAY